MRDEAAIWRLGMSTLRGRFRRTVASLGRADGDRTQAKDMSIQPYVFVIPYLILALGLCS